MFQSGTGVIEELAAVQAGIEDLWERNRLLQLVTILWAIQVLGLIYVVRVIGDEMRGIH